MQINEINRPHCSECGKVYQGDSIGVAYVFNFAVVRLCELCNEKFTLFFTRRSVDKQQQQKLIEASDKDGK